MVVMELKVVPAQPALSVPCMLQNKDIVQLQVGYHVIEGKKVPLKKPMAILETVKQDSSAGSSDSSMNEGSTQSSSSSSTTHCKVSPTTGATSGVSCRKRAYDAGALQARVLNTVC